MVEKRLVRCVERGDAVTLLAELNRLGRQNVAHCAEAETALCLAATAGFTACVRMLLDYGVSPECENEYGDPPLASAAKNIHIHVVEVLLNNSANIFHRDGRHDTALDIACRLGLVPMIQLIQRHFRFYSTSVRPSHVTSDEWDMFCYTALLATIEGDQPKLLSMLIDVGFDINLNLEDDVGTPLHAAIDEGNVDCADILIDAGADIEALRMCVLETPLMFCAQCGQAEIAHRLLVAGCDINRQTEECSTALTIACHYGNESVVCVLLEFGADPRIVNKWGFNALFMATDSPPVLSVLLHKAKLKPAELDKLCGERGEAAIHVSSVVGDTQCVSLLLDAGASINNRTSVNENALWLAVMKGHVDLVKFLVCRNIELDVPSNGCQVYAWDYLPLEVALGMQNYYVAKLLIKAGCRIRNELYYPEGEDQDPGPLEEVPMLRVRPETVLRLKDNADELQWFADYLSQPLTLKHSSRLAIRRILSIGVEKKLQRLPLPSLMKSYVNLSDC